MDSQGGATTRTPEESELVAKLNALRSVATRWRAFAKRMLSVERIRFRGVVGDGVWERDLIVAPRQKWGRMVAENPPLATWSTADFGPLVLALSPPAVTSELAEFD